MFEVYSDAYYVSLEEYMTYCRPILQCFHLSLQKQNFTDISNHRICAHVIIMHHNYGVLHLSALQCYRIYGLVILAYTQKLTHKNPG